MNLPETFEFSKDFIEKAAKERKLQSGVFRFIITKVEKGVGKKDFQWFNIKMTMNPLKDPEDGNSADKGLRVNNWISFPFVNMESEKIKAEGKAVMDTAEEKAALIANMCADNLRAIVGAKSIPWWPRFKDGKMEFMGEFLDKSQKDACRQKVLEASEAVIASIWSDPSMIVNYAPYCRINADGDFPNVSKMWEELPSTVQLTPSLYA